MNNNELVLEVLKYSGIDANLEPQTKSFEGHMKNIEACVPMAEDRTSWIFFHDKSKFVKLNELLKECQKLLKHEKFGQELLTYPDLLSKIATNVNPFCFIKMNENLNTIQSITKKLNRLFSKMTKYSNELTQLEELLKNGANSKQWQQRCLPALKKQGFDIELTYEEFMDAFQNHKNPYPFFIPFRHSHMRHGMQVINDSWENNECNSFQSKSDILSQSRSKTDELSEEVTKLTKLLDEKEIVIKENEEIIREKERIIKDQDETIKGLQG